MGQTATLSNHSHSFSDSSTKLSAGVRVEGFSTYSGLYKQQPQPYVYSSSAHSLGCIQTNRKPKQFITINIGYILSQSKTSARMMCALAMPELG